MKTSLPHPFFLGVWSVVYCLWVCLQAQEAGGEPVTASPAAEMGPEAPSAPAKLQTTAQVKALSQALYAQAAKREMTEGFEAALPLYLNVLKVDPGFIDLQVKVAFYYLQERQSGRALEQLTKAAEANPGSGQIQAALGYLHQVNGRFDQAIASAKKALELAPTYPLSHRLYFETLRDSGKLSEAMAHARTLPKITSTDAKFWLEMARSFTEVISASSRLTKEELSAYILPLFDQAFAYSSPEPSQDLLRQRGDFALLLDRRGEALDYLKRASQIGEPNPQLFVRVANLCSQLDRREEALKYFEQAYELAPDFQLLREQLAYHYVLVGQEEKAIGILEAILAKSPTRSRVYSALGDLYREAKQMEKAESNYRQAIALEPTNPDDHLKLSLLLINQKRLSEAATALAEARQRFPQSARVALFDAITQREMKNYQNALDLFAQAKILADEKDKEFPYASYYYELSLAFEQAGKPQQSESTLKQGLALEPNNENLMNALAYLWAQQGRNLAEGIKLSKRSLQIAPDRGEFLDTLGWLYFKQGKYQEALPLLEKAASMTDDHFEVLEHLADTYAKLGRTQEAITALQRILEKEPDNSPVRQKLETLNKDMAQTQAPVAP